ncbi:CDP-alcohol phosphatidyltransferase family protein [Rubripirellula reticaptiva]|uniref:CDP-alcohol phosphatidyltransferase n=1 Tax=Rubripirellula reticaptiva TaxID=2528013 RepID=A0A5C6ES48_9BACT|nr:CDP-alcohol phosphatidyltransferase family protein [Rubripirellula reticaptiva]TWU51832.1 CDP-alcohol phosphatidyltransferase [Rubripirellula reticaptiva]
MSKRVSHSLLDPYIGPPLAALYPRLPIPRWFPPEGIVAIGHLSAIGGAIGLAISTQVWWGGLIAAVGIAGNHFADCIDGRHARATGQCRNGGELLDHFTDPLSFTYWMVGLAVACGRLDLGLVAVIALMAMAVLTNLRAKLTGEFTLAAFGPTEFKSLLAGFGVVLAIIGSLAGLEIALASATVGLATLCILGVTLLPIQLFQSVREVNRFGGQPDTSDWETTRSTTHPAAQKNSAA